MDIFKFKKFSVYQSENLMKVGTDGVLLGAGVSCQNKKRILDVGTGTGLVALMMAQRCLAEIDAIDINPDAIFLAKQNFSNSPWSSRLSAICCQIQQYKTNYKYDLIVSNPPYFISGNSAPLLGRAIARHSSELSLKDLLFSIYQLLDSNGSAEIIYPELQNEYFISECENAGLFISKRLLISPKTGYKPNRIIYKLGKNEVQTIDSFLTIENELRHQYTLDYIELTKDFYIKM